MGGSNGKGSRQKEQQNFREKSRMPGRFQKCSREGAISLKRVRADNTQSKRADQTRPEPASSLDGQQ